MTFKNYNEVIEYLQHQQVYLRIQIADINLKPIAEKGILHHFHNVSINRINPEKIALCIEIEEVEATLYLDKNDEEFYKFVKMAFVPLSELVKSYNLITKK